MQSDQRAHFLLNIKVSIVLPVLKKSEHDHYERGFSQREILNGALLYRKGLSSNTANPLAVIGGSLRIELRSSTNRAVMLKSSFIRT